MITPGTLMIQKTYYKLYNLFLLIESNNTLEILTLPDKMLMYVNNIDYQQHRFDNWINYPSNLGIKVLK